MPRHGLPLGRLLLLLLLVRWRHVRQAAVQRGRPVLLVLLLLQLLGLQPRTLGRVPHMSADAIAF